MATREKYQLAELRKYIVSHFNDEELRTLCFDLNIDYDSLPAAGKDGKTRELVAHLDRHKRIPELMEELKRERSEVFSDDLPSLVLKEVLVTVREVKTEPVRYTFCISDKHFDEGSDPQKIIIRFTNLGNELIQIDKVKYNDTGLGLPQQALLSSYKRDCDGRCLIPFDHNKSKVLPGQHFFVELHLGQIWKRADIFKWAGEWGYLRIFVIRGDSTEAEMEFYSI